MSSLINRSISVIRVVPLSNKVCRIISYDKDGSEGRAKHTDEIEEERPWYEVMTYLCRHLISVLIRQISNCPAHVEEII